MESAAAPNWDMTSFFTAPGGPDYTEFRANLDRDLKALDERLQSSAPLAVDTHLQWQGLLVELEDIEARLEHLFSYLCCLGAADSTDEWTKAETAALASLRARGDKLVASVRAQLGECKEDAMVALCGAEQILPVAYHPARLRTQARQSMPAELEGLAADLGVNGLSAWSRLYDQISGNLTFDMTWPGGERKSFPVAMTRSLLENPDAEVRRAALEGANHAWESVADSLTACLNAIAGTRLSLYERRGIDDFLSPALFDARIERKTLDAMFEAVRSRREVAWRYYQQKAGVLGIDRLRFSDIMAPYPSEAGSEISWGDGVSTVVRAFESFYPRLGAFASRAIESRWVDYEPRAGKRPGGFCVHSSINGESRVFMTYNQTAGDVQTLAHELGHAFHGEIMHGMRYWATCYPMTLAETASTFAEEIVSDALLASSSLGDTDRRSRLDGKLLDAATFLCNIPMRFTFEKAFYQERAGGEVSTARLCELMRDAQLEWYGTALDPDALDPWFWASKLHFYIPELSFYNFPYTFGYLFSIALFAQAKSEGPDFFERYERLLRNSGSAPAEEVASEALGVDIGDASFWHGSIDHIESDLARYQG